jgi:hypothetical protein
MNSSQYDPSSIIVGIIFNLGFWVLIIFGIVYLIKNASDGVRKPDWQRGEDRTRDIINKLFPDEHKYVIQNAFIPLQNGNHTEIDIIFIHKSFIYVIENKHYSGWIFGSATQRQWTQTFPNGEKYKLYNPIMQNQTHINALSQLLNIDNSKFMSYIVFSGDCELKAVPPNTHNRVIIDSDYLYNALRYNMFRGVESFTDSEMYEIFIKVAPYANLDPEVKEKHFERINQKR